MVQTQRPEDSLLELVLVEAWFDCEFEQLVFLFPSLLPQFLVSAVFRLRCSDHVQVSPLLCTLAHTGTSTHILCEQTRTQANEDLVLREIAIVASQRIFASRSSRGDSKCAMQMLYCRCSEKPGSLGKIVRKHHLCSSIHTRSDAYSSTQIHTHMAEKTNTRMFITRQTFQRSEETNDRYKHARHHGGTRI